MTYGLNVSKSEYGPRGVIGTIETSADGNLVLRAGRENSVTGNGPAGWHKTEHIVMEPEEATEFIEALVEKMGPPRLDVDVLREQAHKEWEIAKLIGDDEATEAWALLMGTIFNACDLYRAKVPA